MEKLVVISLFALFAFSFKPITRDMTLLGGYYYVTEVYIGPKKQPFKFAIDLNSN